MQAAKMYDLRRRGIAQPYGSYKNKVWIPDERERQPCCDRLWDIHSWKINYEDQPKWSHVDELMAHCKSTEHVANLFGIDPIVFKQFMETAWWAVKDK